jgi:hypothetical protein
MFNFEFATSKTGIQKYVSISRYGVSINRPVLDEMKGVDKVVLGYDSENSILGILRYDVDQNYPDDVKTFQLLDHLKKDGSQRDWVRISCKPFIRFLADKSKINFISKTHKYEAQIIDGGVIAVLKEETSRE